jgi:peptidoglycan/LPS O-acetylase OafA/YrhL
MKRYSFIDGLRAIAVLPVIFFHFGLAGFSGGYVGVDVFFVISGFLITGLIIDQKERHAFSLLHFYERRARRILPALFFTCLLTTAAAWFLFMPQDFRDYAKSLKGLAFFASNFVFARETGYFANTALVMPLLHTWSLAVEEQFYLIFPLILGIAFYFRKKHASALPTTIYLIFSISFALSVAFISTAPERTFYLLPSRAWELLAGSIISLHLRMKPMPAWAAEGASFIGVILLIASVTLYGYNTPFPGYAALLPIAAAVLIIWSNTQHSTRVGRILSGKILSGTGLISYGLYLYHWPINIFTRYYLERPLNAPEVIVACLATFLLAVPSYLFVERPIRASVFLKSRPSVFYFSICGLALMAAIGIAGIRTNGFPSRFNGAALQYAMDVYSAPPADAIHGGCDPVAPEHLNAETVCKVGDIRKAFAPSFLVWGDSHAEALSPAVRALAQAHGVSGWQVTYDGCPSLIGTRRTDTRIKFSCYDVGNSVLRLVRDNHIKNILLISRWDMHALGGEHGSIEEYRTPTISFSLPDKRVLTGLEAFAASLDQTIQQLQAMGVNIWIVKQVPPYLEDIASGLAKSVYLGRDQKKLERPYEDIISRRAPIDSIFLQEGNDSISYIDPLEQFCPGKTTCQISYGGHALYRDNNHLTVYGALWSKHMLEPFFDSLQSRP